MLSPLAAIVVNLIVFTAIFELFNSSVEWIFNLIDVENMGLDVRIRKMGIKQAMELELKNTLSNLLNRQLYLINDS